MKLYIKYMVSRRCKMIVDAELTRLGIKHLPADMGTVVVEGVLTESKHEELGRNLLTSGLELLDEKKSIFIEKIKYVISTMIQLPDELPDLNYSDILSEKVGYDYTYLSNVFSEVTGITIQQYIIIQRIEKVKELMLYDELNLTEISQKLHFSSVAHLSNQFKKVTGLSPSFYKKLKRKRSNNPENPE